MRYVLNNKSKNIYVFLNLFLAAWNFGSYVHQTSVYTPNSTNNNTTYFKRFKKLFLFKNWQCLRNNLKGKIKKLLVNRRQIKKYRNFKNALKYNLVWIKITCFFHGCFMKSIINILISWNCYLWIWYFNNKQLEMTII